MICIFQSILSSKIYSIECEIPLAFVRRTTKTALVYKIVLHVVPKQRFNEFPLINFWRFKIV